MSTGTQPIKVQPFVENTGDVAGAEVVQVYLSLPQSAGEPPKRLVAFSKVHLEPGETRRVRLRIDPAASHHPLSVWDAAADRWTTPDGELGVHVGTSSADTDLARTVRVRTTSGTR